MSGLEPLPLFPCPVLSLARCFRGDDGDHSSSTVLIVVFRWFNPRLLFSKSKKTVKTYYWPIFLVVAAVVGGGRHVWTCRDGGSGNGCAGHSRAGGRFVFAVFRY